MNYSWLLPPLIALAVAGCNKAPETTAKPNEHKRSEYVAKIEACSLITREEVGAVQSTTISDAKSSETSDGSHLVTQCYYASTGPNLSVSVTLTQPDSTKPEGPSPRDYWEQIFGPYRNPSKAEEKEQEKGAAKDKEKGFAGGRGEEEERKIPPKKIDGVGDEAYWSGNRFGGALYVLKADFIVRISVGGPDNEEIKISKSKALAEKALSRL